MTHDAVDGMRNVCLMSNAGVSFAPPTWTAQMYFLVMTSVCGVGGLLHSVVD
jgi:hypothetical protein